MAGEQQPRDGAAEKVGRERRAVSRRRFLKGSGAAALGAAFAACRAPAPEQRSLPIVPTPTTPPPDGVLNFFGSDEAAIVEALTARIVPSDEEGPGAREAGAVYYIDRLLDRHDSAPAGRADPGRGGVRARAIRVPDRARLGPRPVPRPMSVTGGSVAARPDRLLRRGGGRAALLVLALPAPAAACGSPAAIRPSSYSVRPTSTRSRERLE